jgi:hypothetical protein
MISDTPPGERLVFTPSQLNSEIRHALERGFPVLWVEGEISNLARPGSGHLYFSLKDAQSQIRCAMFRNRNMLVRFTPANGTQVLLRARISVYEPRGEYQLIVEHMEEAGGAAWVPIVESEFARTLPIYGARFCPHARESRCGTEQLTLLGGFQVKRNRDPASRLCGGFTIHRMSVIGGHHRGSRRRPGPSNNRPC